MRFCPWSLALGLEHSCPWPRECLSSERLSLALASDFFCVLGLEPCVLDSTSEAYKLEVESRTQGLRPRPSTQKNLRPRTALPRAHPLEAKDRNARGQGQGPKTKAQVLSKKKKNVFTKSFSGNLQKKMSSKNFFRRSTKF